MAQALQMAPGQMTPEMIQTDGFMTTCEQRMTWVLNGLVFLLGVVTLFGYLLDIPRLYDWDARGLVMHYQVAISLMALSIGYALQQVAVVYQKPTLKILALFCYGFVLGFGIFKLAVFLEAGNIITMQQFLQPSSPSQGNLSFQTSLGVSVAAAAALSIFMVKPKQSWTPWIPQGLAIILISIASFALAENMGSLTIFRHLISIPASLGFLFFGISLLFYPFEDFHLRVPFFSSGLIRLYTTIFCILWVLIVAWQAIWSNVSLGMTDFTQYHVHASAVIDEFLEANLSALILGLGLHMLSRMVYLKRTKDALQEANGKLEVALDSINMLASTLSHDLKTPIKIQMNTVEMLLKGQFGKSIDDDSVREMLTAMLDSKRFEHELVLNLVDLLRYKMQQERFVPKPFEINKLLTDIQKDLEPLAQGKNQALIIHPDIGRKEITADYFGMKRILHNLVNNAIQHLDTGCRIEVQVQDGDGEYLFQVKDNGPGIAPDVQENLFKRFNRVSSSGLGLYISKQIVERHGGRIWIKSKPGQGTSFSFTIPTDEQPSPSVQSES